MLPSPPSARPVVGRLAPSPTGGLHLGHARTFLAAWLAARRDGGRIVLRIEDLDAGRVRPGATEQAMADLRWLGLDWDEGPDVPGPAGPYIQSARLDHYRRALARLIAGDRVYPCTCTRAEIARAASAPHAEDEGPSYPGTCAHRHASDAASLHGRPFAWRFRVPAGRVEWPDRMRGWTAIEPSLVGGDFIVARVPEAFAYQLAVVVDDAAMGVTQVVRGDDLVPSTPRQILLARALDLPIPTYAHLPLVLDEQGHRLAKRDGAIKLATLGAAGVDPRRLIRDLAGSLGLGDRGGAASPREWIEDFRWDRVPAEPWRIRPTLMARWRTAE